MLQNIFLNRLSSLITSTVFLSLSLTACDIDINTNIPDVPPEGRFAVVVANQHTGVSSAQVGIAIFDNGDPINLVGGDIVQASTVNDSILLLDTGVYNGSYVASLPNESNFDLIDFLMIHAPLEARQGRWYPVDLLNIDPGPGEFVGASATIVLPPTPANISLNNTNFNNINDNFDITWTPEIAGDRMKVRSAITCSNESNTSTYGTEAVLLDTSDDGFENIGLDQFIYDINDQNQTIKFILPETRSVLQELLLILSDNGFDDEFFSNFEILNPIENTCEIRLFLFRERTGVFDSPTTNGNIFGSRSADITLFYNPG